MTSIDPRPQGQEGDEISRTFPFESAIAIIAAASITHDKGFHMNPRNFKNLLSCKSHALALHLQNALGKF